MFGRVKKFPMLINAENVEASSGEWIDSYNPYTGKVWARVPRGSVEDAEQAVDAAYQAFSSGEWQKLNPTQRGKLLRNLADLISKNVDELAQYEVLDNGKLMAEMHLQVSYVPEFLYYFAGLADKIEGAVIPVEKPNHMCFTRHEPLGVVVGITPWNSPLLLMAMKLAPALAAGNTIVLKPSEHASVSTIAFAKLVEKAGFPPGVVNVVTGYGHEIGEALTKNSHVAKIAFTGGEEAGRTVYQQAAESFKRVTLELGGKSPNIVFDDADMDKALSGVIGGIFAATGQTCIAGSRLLVQRSIHDEFVEKLVTFAKQARMGNPMKMDTQVGPVTTQEQYNKVLDYIGIAKKEGAEAVLGGGEAKRPECGDGWFVEPTIFTNVRNNMRIAQEEVFGPVLSVIPFEDDQDAIDIANDVIYGLASGVWTENMSRALKVSAAIKAGTVWVNTYRAFSTMAPFGGYKHSGIGRENGIEAIYEYLQTKSVWISMADAPDNPFIMRL